MRLSTRIAAICAIATCAAGGMALPAGADPVADFYKGKQITIQVGFGAGGGYDTTARVYARHFGKHVPGNPTVIVQNVPGAGSQKVANAIYNTAPKDGTVLGVFSSSVAMVPLYGKQQTKFETDKFEWIGSLHRDIQGCAVWNGAGQNIRTLPDFIAAKQTIIFGSNGPTSPLTIFPLFIKNAFDARVKVVHGYKGTKEINLAMQKGELNATCGMYESSIQGAFLQSLQSGELNMFVQFGLDRDVKLFGKATNIFTMLKTDEERKMARLVFGPAEITRPFAAPPGTPKDRVAALRKAMMDTAKDPEFVADGAKVKTVFEPIPGEEVAAAFEEYFKTPKALVEKANLYITKMD